MHDERGREGWRGIKGGRERGREGEREGGREGGREEGVPNRRVETLIALLALLRVLENAIT